MQVAVKLSGKVAIAVLGSASLALAGGTVGAAAAAHPGARPAPAVGRMLRVPHAAARTVRGTTQLQSFNWSGYAQSAANGTYKAVEDTWTVPTVNTTLPGSQFSADWVGVGGLNDATLVQAGTEADNIGGTAKYDAWTEILPAAEVVIPGLTIKPGNKILTTVVEIKTGTWKMTVKDLTTGKSGGKTVSYSSSGASVEAIHERPCILDGCTSTSDLAALTKTNKVSFDPGELSTAAPGTPSFKPLLKTVPGATLNEIFMVNNAGTAVIAAPSSHDSDNDGFRVAYGSTSPTPPKS